MLHRQYRRDDDVAVGVAILTGPGGPVLHPAELLEFAALQVELRSSPVPEGRCCVRGPVVAAVPDGGVAIRTGPGGPVLP